MTILLLVLAHLIADFYLQTETMVSDKKKYLLRHLVHHTITIFLALTVLYFVQGTEFLTQVLLPTLVIVTLHGVVDGIKIKLQEKSVTTQRQNSYNLSLFVGDRLLHIISILVVCYLFIKVDLGDIFHYILLSLKLIEGVQPDHGLVNSLLFLCIMFILCTSVTGHLIKIMLGTLTRHLSLFEGKYTLRDLAVSATSEKNMSEEYTYMVMKHQIYQEEK